MDANISLVRPWTFLSLAVILFIILSYLLFRGDWKRSCIALLAAAVCAFFSDADSFAFFKFSPQGGIEARAKVVVAEAESATYDLKKVAVAAATAIVTINGGTVSNGGIAMTPAASVIDTNKRRLILSLKNMGVSEKDVHSVELADREGVISTYEFALWLHMPTLGGSSSIGGTLAQQKAFGTKEGGLDPGKALEYIYSRNDFTDQFTVELLKDYQTYLATGQQRRPEVWAERDTWYQVAK